MTEQKTKKLSRRDALKILGAAAGASVLANLPSKWTKPELAAGVLPAHAQTSILPVIYSLICAANGTLSGAGTFNAISSVGINPPDPGISMDYSISLLPTLGTAILDSPSPSSGTVVTNGSGVASILFQISTTPSFGTSLGEVEIQWDFGSSVNGVGVCLQFFPWNYSIP